MIFFAVAGPTPLRASRSFCDAVLRSRAAAASTADATRARTHAAASVFENSLFMTSPCEFVRTESKRGVYRCRDAAPFPYERASLLMVREGLQLAREISSGRTFPACP